MRHGIAHRVLPGLPSPYPVAALPNSEQWQLTATQGLCPGAEDVEEGCQADEVTSLT